MKNFLVIFMALLAISLLFSCRATYVVRERPAEVVYLRPAPPSRDHVWISGNWVWMTGHYQWQEGHWQKRYEDRHWVDGFWEPVHGGWKWVAGHWR